MKKTLLTLSFLSVLFCSCEESPFQPSHRFPVQGKWKISQVTVNYLDGKDSVTSSGLGWLEFGRYSDDDNGAAACKTGNRIYQNGTSINFHFQTFRTHDNDGADSKILRIATKIYDPGNDLFGRYKIEKLTEHELIISCENCSVGTNPPSPLLKKFTLTAVKE